MTTLVVNNVNGNFTSSGEAVHYITSEERSTFGFASDDKLKDMIKNSWGPNDTPGNVYLRDPTKFGDSFLQYGHDEVRTRLKPISSELLSTTEELILVNEATYLNDTDRDTTFKVNMEVSKAKTTTSGWESSNQFSFGNETSVGVNIEIVEANTTFSANFTSSYGQQHSYSETITVGTGASVNTVVKPGERATVNLRAWYGKAKMKFVYQGRLTGDVMHNYDKKVNDHYIWFSSLPGVLSANSMSNSKTITQIIDVDTYGKHEMQLNIENPNRSHTKSIGRQTLQQIAEFVSSNKILQEGQKKINQFKESAKNTEKLEGGKKKVKQFIETADKTHIIQAGKKKIEQAVTKTHITATQSGKLLK